MGVADGVGSWSSDGVDPSKYPKELVEAAQTYLNTPSETSHNPLQCLQYAHEHAKAPGSATMCISMVLPDGLLEVANLGDCGLRVIRGSKCVFSTEVRFF